MTEEELEALGKKLIFSLYPRPRPKGLCVDLQALREALEAAEAKGLRENREHTEALDRNWETIHSGAMKAIGFALGLPMHGDGDYPTIPEMKAAIRGLQAKLSAFETAPLHVFAEDKEKAIREAQARALEWLAGNPPALMMVPETLRRVAQDIRDGKVTP